jgi:hypothetical protein
VWIGPAIALALALGASAEDPPPDVHQSFGVGTGFDFSTGDYGESSATDIWYVPLTLRYERGPWTGRLTVPYLRITGRGDVVGGLGGAEVVGSSDGPRETDAGLGDIVAGLTYAIEPRSPWFPFIELTGRVKFPTASRARGLGTGEFDYSVQLDVSESFGSATPYLMVGYRFVGNPPGSDLHDTVFSSLGVAYRIVRGLTVGLSYDWRQTASRRLGDVHELSPYVSWRMSEHVTLGPYAVVGLSRAAPQYGVGLQIGYRY